MNVILPFFHLKPLSVFFTIVLLSTSLRAQPANDKVTHAAVGLAIYGICVAAGAIGDIDWINYKTCLIPVGVAAVGKELYDRNNNGHPEKEDAEATFAGPAFISGATLTILAW